MEVYNGNKIRIISGGPVMTVDRVWSTYSGRKFCVCKWFDNKGILHTGEFASTSLVLE